MGEINLNAMLRIGDLLDPGSGMENFGSGINIRIRNNALFREAGIGHGAKDGQSDHNERGYDAQVQVHWVPVMFSPRDHQ